MIYILVGNTRKFQLFKNEGDYLRWFCEAGEVVEDDDNFFFALAISLSGGIPMGLDMAFLISES